MTKVVLDTNVFGFRNILEGRVLKPEGEIFVAELYTPESFSKEKLIERAEAHGLEVEFIADDKNREGKPSREDLEAIHKTCTRNPEDRVKQICKGYYVAKLTKKQP